MKSFLRSIVTNFFEWIQPTGKRRRVARGDVDSKQLINKYSRTEGMILARWAYGNEGFTGGAVDSMARYSIGSGIIPQAQTKDKEWNAAAEAYYNEATKVIDITGRFRLPALQKALSRCIDVDGDVGLILTSSESGFPQIQTVMGHRIGNGYDNVPDNMFDGVLVDRKQRPVAYRVLTDSGKGYEDIPAQNFIHLGEAKKPDEYRHMTNLIHALANIQDLIEILGFEKQAVKAAALPALVRIRKQGDGGQSLGDVLSDTEGGTSDTDLKRESLQSGLIVSLEEGEDLKSFASDRPTPALDMFFTTLIKPIALGLGLPTEFVWNPTDLKGAGVRMILRQADRRFAERQDLFIERLLDRLYGWIISKGIKNGVLTANDEWWKVKWQRPQGITVDFGREAQQNRDDLAVGLRTFAEDYGERGRYWEDELDQRAREAAYILFLSKKYQVPPESIAAGSSSSSQSGGDSISDPQSLPSPDNENQDEDQDNDNQEDMNDEITTNN